MKALLSRSVVLYKAFIFCVFSVLITGSFFLLQDEGAKESISREDVPEESQDECEGEFVGTYTIENREYGGQKEYVNPAYDFSVSIPNHWAVDPGIGRTYCLTGGATDWRVGFYNPMYIDRDELGYGYAPAISISVRTGLSKSAYEVAQERNEWIQAEGINEIQIGGMDAFSIESNKGHETYLKTEDGRLFGVSLLVGETQGEGEGVYEEILSSFSFGKF